MAKSRSTNALTRKLPSTGASGDRPPRHKAGKPRPARKQAGRPKSQRIVTNLPQGVVSGQPTTPRFTRPLSMQQERFCQEYVRDLNGTQAAIRASYSPHTAGQQAYDLLRHPQVQARITQVLEARSRHVALETDKTLAVLGCILHADAADLTDAKGNLIPLHLLPAHVRAAIESVEWHNGKLRYKLASKTVALHLAMKYQNLIVDKSEVKVMGDTASMTREQIIAELKALGKEIDPDAGPGPL